ncbi:hypothetical protein MTO96_040323 [Rhipicephalus appendiculatus]
MLQMPIVEEYRFVPYLDNEIASRERKNLLREYVEVCDCISRRALKPTKENNSHSEIASNSSVEVSEELLNRYIDNIAPNQSLLQLLITTQKQANGTATLASTVKSALLASTNALEDDVLNTGLLEEDPLRDVLDVVLENTGSVKLRVLELTDEKSPRVSTCTIGPRVSALLSMYGVRLKTNTLS